MNNPKLWGSAFSLVPDGNTALRGQCLLLVLTCVLTCAAAWWMRFVSTFDRFPLCLLHVVSRPHDEPDDKRKALATMLLDLPGCCLQSNTSDFAAKLKVNFLRDIEYMRDSGQCAPRMFAYLLVWRRELPVDTQDIEGRASSLQVMAKRAPGLQIPAANNRMKVKYGIKMSAEDCCEVHDQVVQFMQSVEWSCRFTPTVYSCGVDLPAGGARACAHQFSLLDKFCKALSLNATGHHGVDIGPKKIYSIDGQWFLLSPWTFKRYSIAFEMSPPVVIDGGVWLSKIHRPFSVRWFHDLLKVILVPALGEDPPTRATKATRGMRRMRR
eukprot:9492622-Pyramimonas_sp.AAC.1